MTTGPEAPRILRSLLTAVLQPPSPIAAITPLTPEIPREGVLDKGIFLDLLVQFDDGTRVDIEMQADIRAYDPNEHRHTLRTEESFMRRHNDAWAGAA